MLFKVWFKAKPQKREQIAHNVSGWENCAENWLKEKRRNPDDDDGDEVY